MDSGSDDCRVPPSSEAVEGSSDKADDPSVETEASKPAEKELSLTALGLLPVPAWARKPPRTSESEPGLFDNE
jgi:hypothetical protein